MTNTALNEKIPAARKSGLRKLEPTARMPAPSLQKRLSVSARGVLEQVLSETYECVYDPIFRRISSEKTLMTALPGERESTIYISNDDSGLDMLSPPRHKVLSADEERELFLRFNYCRYRVMKVLRQFAGKRLTIPAAREVLKWAGEALATRNTIVRLNTSLVMAMARRTKTSGVELGDLISEGNLALLRCVDKFDCARGFKFSTYACRAIMSGFARLAAKSARYRSQFPAPYDPALERSDETETRRVDEAEDCVRGLKVILAQNTAELSAVEQRVINARFSLDQPVQPERRGRAPTLEQVGELLGVSKERVRQIQNRALKKLRTVVEDEVLAAS